MAKATKGTKAVKAVEVELTPEQKAANARRVALRKLLGTHSLQSTAWELQYSIKELESESRSAIDYAQRVARDVAVGYIGGISYTNNCEARINALSAKVQEQFRALSSIAHNSVAAYESASALGAQIADGEVVRLVCDTEEGQRTVAILTSDFSPEFEVLPIALLLSMNAGKAVYIAEAV